jgi:hypothetical protein
MPFVVLAGLAVGVATSALRTYLNSPWLALVNSASPWLVAPFAVGALQRRAAAAAVAGLVTCALEVAGYYLTASLRGFPGDLGYEVLWTGCAIVGGPLFGVAGYLWRTGRSRLLRAAGGRPHHGGLASGDRACGAARGSRDRRMTTRVGDRLTTSSKPARSYRLREPKNMKSAWLRAGLSTG